MEQIVAESRKQTEVILREVEELPDEVRHVCIYIYIHMTLYLNVYWPPSPLPTHTYYYMVTYTHYHIIILTTIWSPGARGSPDEVLPRGLLPG
jgi:hypothetical protein